MRPPVVERALRSCSDVDRRVKVGLADLEMNDLSSAGFELARPSGRLEGRFGSQVVHPPGEAHVEMLAGGQARSGERNGTIRHVPRFYDIDAANTRLAELRPLLERLKADRGAVAEAQAELVRFSQTNGDPRHSAGVQERQARVRELVRRMRHAVGQIEGWDVTLRDIESGLVDFPALASGRPIWLCWRFGEDEIAWWHEQGSGFEGRKPLLELT